MLERAAESTRSHFLPNQFCKRAHLKLDVWHIVRAARYVRYYGSRMGVIICSTFLFSVASRVIIDAPTVLATCSCNGCMHAQAQASPCRAAQRLRVPWLLPLLLAGTSSRTSPPAGRRRRPEIVRVEEDLCTFPVRDGPRRSRAGIYGPQVGRGQHPPTNLLLLPKGVAVRSRTRARARALTPSWSAAAAPVPAGRSASALRWAW